MRHHRHPALDVQPVLDRVTGETRCFRIVDADGEEVATGIATRQDAEDRIADTD
jgi:hypothetical protein